MDYFIRSDDAAAFSRWFNAHDVDPTTLYPTDKAMVTAFYRDQFRPILGGEKNSPSEASLEAVEAA